MLRFCIWNSVSGMRSKMLIFYNNQCSFDLLVMKECFSPMGMSNGTIMDHEISGSSTIDKAHPAFYARVITARNERVSTRGSWCAKLADKEQFLEIDLKKPRKVTGQSWMVTFPIITRLVVTLVYCCIVLSHIFQYTFCQCHFCRFWYDLFLPELVKTKTNKREI